MTFGRPEALMLAPALGGVLLGALWLYWRRARRLVEALGGAEPALRLTGRRLDRAPRARAALLGCGAVTLALAAADLRTGTVGTQGSGATDVVLVLDASLSMSADDVGPTRLGRAKAIAAELARAPGDGYTGLVVFAGWPYELVPLTDDLDVIDFFLAPMGAELFPEADRGTSLAVAISQARRTLAARAAGGRAGGRAPLRRRTP